jgi:hypothetical protein
MAFWKCGLRSMLLVAALAAPSAVAASTVELRASPLVDLYYLVRAVADTAATAPELAGLDEAVAEARRMQAALGSPLRWGLLEGRLAACDSAAQIEAAFEALPESVSTGGDRSVPLRAGAVRLAHSLGKIEAEFRAEVWPRHEREIAGARAGLEATFVPRAEECLRFIEASFRLAPLPQPVPIYLVAESPAPHGFTHRGRGGAVCFIGLRGTPEPLLEETILHEATHAVSVGSEKSLLTDLGDLLAKAGIEAKDKRHRDAVHTLFFIQAGETMRRLIDPGHRDYGDAMGYYAKVRPIAEVERPIWKACLDGKIAPAEALEKIVAGLSSGNAGR